MLVHSENVEAVQSVFKFRTREENREWLGMPIPQPITDQGNHSNYLEWLTALIERINGTFTPSLQGKDKCFSIK